MKGFKVLHTPFKVKKTNKKNTHIKVSQPGILQFSPAFSGSPLTNEINVPVPPGPGLSTLVE